MTLDAVLAVGAHSAEDQDECEVMAMYWCCLVSMGQVSHDIVITHREEHPTRNFYYQGNSAHRRCDEAKPHVTRVKYASESRSESSE